MAKGVEYASGIYGGRDFALSFGGNEMPGYHTGPACHIGYLTSARHSHLDSAGYSIDQKAGQKGISLAPEDVAESLFREESWRQVLTSLVICLFARGIYTDDTVLQALGCLGITYTKEELTNLGMEILKLKYQFKVREGFNLENIRIPGRIIETVSPLGKLDEEFLRSSIARYGELITNL
jgi:aldehyde:ferredoxin oxidoreductase